MDYVDIKPVGVYGSKNELIRFLKQLNVIDYYTYVFDFFYCLEIIAEKKKSETLLREEYDVSRIKPTLRPGLYGLVVEAEATSDRSVYIIFWPEEKTWDDDASSTVCKNRTTFMR